MDAMGRLAGGVAHDFNNLLTVINGWCEALSSPSPDERKAAVDQIASAAAKAANLTAQLLSFGRKSAAEPSVVDLNPIIEDIARMLRRVIGEDVCLETVLVDTPALVTIDHGQLSQVLVNLALNGRDAMPRGGSLRVETARLELDAREAAANAVPPGTYITLTVSDTGTGIPADALPRLFEPFFTTKADRGTGLGLAAAQEIVQQAGGVISAANRPEGGARFSILLPEASRPCPARPAAATGTCDGRGGGIVLVVEDDAQVRLITVSMLKSRGYQVLEAATCQAALSLATTHDQIDLLVTDVVMPELSGPELATRIRTVHPAVRVLLVSGYSADAVARHGVNGAAPSFLQKPFTGQQLGGRSATCSAPTFRRARWCCNDPGRRDGARGGAPRSPALVRHHRYPARSRLRQSRRGGGDRGRGAAGLHRLRGRSAVVGQGVGGSRAAGAAARRHPLCRRDCDRRTDGRGRRPRRSALRAASGRRSRSPSALLRRAAAGTGWAPGGGRAVPVEQEAARAQSGATRRVAARGAPNREAGVVPPSRDGTGGGARGAGDWRGAVPAAGRHGHRRHRDRRRRRPDSVRESSIQAGDKPTSYWIAEHGEYDGNCRARLLSS